MFCWWCFPLSHCYRDTLCVSATSTRSVCDLHDCSQIKMWNAILIQDIVDRWFGLLSYACVFYTHLSTWNIPTPNCMKMHHLKWRITKKFLGRGSPDPYPTGERDTPPGPYPARRLDARAFGTMSHGQLPRISSDPRNAPGIRAYFWNKIEYVWYVSSNFG